jgi:formate--tetrahydrofolate ligase
MIKSDLEIAQEIKLTPIVEIAEKAGLKEEEIELYGKYKAKISLSVLERLKDRKDAKFIAVTAITPTPLGEGKTVTAIGLGQALAKIGKNVINTMRQPSLGPVFGIKGGATGGGYSQALPMEDINLHFTGDTHAVAAANNLCAAMLDTSILKGNPLNIDPLAVSLRRVVDISDRALREIVIGLGGRENGYPRVTGFDIAVACELMAILALANSLEDLKQRIGRMHVAYTYDNKPVTPNDLQATGAMTVLLKDAIKPNLCQSTEHHPIIIHSGPFANVAHGNNSILADLIALKLADYVVTECGFGADCGFEKLMDVKCRQGVKFPDCAVIVCSIRALKMHGGAFKAIPGKKIDPELIKKPNPEAVRAGCSNLRKQIENVKLFKVPVVVAINKFLTDTQEEIEVVKEEAKGAGAEDAVLHEVWEHGGAGGIELAEAVVKACDKPSSPCNLYPDDLSIKEKIEILATKVYGADSVEYSPTAESKIEFFTKLGLDKLSINMAKTHLSLSHDPNLKGAPTGYKFPISDIRPSVGAGFLYPIAGAMRTMPGLPTRPAACDVDIDAQGRVIGLF